MSATSLGSSFVGQLDGGVWTAILAWASALLADDGDAAPGTTWTDSTTSSSASYSSTSSSNVSSTGPTVGDFLIPWLLQRLSGQVGSFVCAGLWFVFSFASFIILLVVTRPSRDGSSSTNGSDVNDAASSASLTRRLLLTAKKLLSRWWWRRTAGRLRFVLGLLFVLTVLIFLSFVALITFWCVNASTTGLFSTGGDANSTTSASGIVNTIVNTAMNYVTDTIVETNSTALGVGYSEMPDLLNLVNRLASRLLDLLLADFNATPLLDSLDNFLALVKLLLSNMNAIVAARDTTVASLMSFTNLVNTTKNDLLQQVESFCSETYAPATLCTTVTSALPNMQVNVNYKQLSTDSSVTIVTLLDKIFKFNITQIESQIGGLKSGLTGGLGAVESQVSGLYDSLVSLVSKAFADLLDSLEVTRDSLLNVTSSDDFQSIATGLDIGVTIIFAVTILSAVFVLSFSTFVLFYTWGYWWHARRKGSHKKFIDVAPPAGIDNARDVADNPKEAVDEVGQRRSAVGRSRSVRQHRKTAKNRADRLKTQPKLLACAVFGCVCSFLFLIGFLFLYAGSEVQMDACRYVTEERGVKVLDSMVDEFVNDSLWRMIEPMTGDLPVTVTRQMMPSQILQSLKDQCGNSSVTIFQIFDLIDAFNMTQLLQSAAIAGVLNDTRASVHGLISSLNVTTLVPSDVTSILATLPDFARVVDAEDYSASIQELQKPLLKNQGSEEQLLDNLDSLATQALTRNATDTRGILIRYFSVSLRSKISSQSSTLNASLAQLREQYESLQNNRYVLNISLEVISRLELVTTTLGKTAFLHAQVDSRFDQTVTEFTPEAAQFLENLATKLMTSVGSCYGILSTFDVVTQACNGSFASISWSGLTLMLTSLLLSVTFWFLMLLLRSMRIHKNSVRGPTWTKTNVYSSNC